MMFEKSMKFPILLDTYGSLLTDRKREILDYYYNEDYSLAEISGITGNFPSRCSRFHKKK